MDSFIYSINSTVPIFLVMILGWVIKRLGIIDDNFASKANKYVFKVALPVLLFRDLSATDFKSQFDAKFVIYCMVVTILMFSIIWILTEIFMKDESMKGAFVIYKFSFNSSYEYIIFIVLLL
jgi:malate permease and related proteins